TVWLQVHPGTETTALLAMANVIGSDGLHAQTWLDAYVDGLSDWMESVQAVSPEDAAEVCGVSADDIRRAARLYAKGGFIRNNAPGDNGLYPPSAAFFGAGLTNVPGGEEASTALINLALLTGNLGRAGAGIWPLRDGTNHQGAYDVSCVPAANGLTYSQMLAGASS